jgi:hypothetical protein
MRAKTHLDEYEPGVCGVSIREGAEGKGGEGSVRDLTCSGEGASVTGVSSSRGRIVVASGSVAERGGSGGRSFVCMGPTSGALVREAARLCR